jgi:hypothetical protein
VLHSVSGAVASPCTNRIAGAYEDATENAVRNPAYARHKLAGLPPGTLSAEDMLRTVAKSLGRAPTSAARAATAGGVVTVPDWNRQH